MIRVLMTASKQFLGLVPITSYVWFNKIGFYPTIYHIARKHEPHIQTIHGEINRIEVSEEHHNIWAQSLWYRFFAAQFFPNDICIISDVDMLPMNRYFFCDLVDFITDYPDKIVHTNKSNGRTRVCYVAGYGRVWSKIIENNFVKSLNRVRKEYDNRFVFDEGWLSEQYTTEFPMYEWAKHNRSPGRIQIKYRQETYCRNSVDVHIPLPSDKFYQSEQYSNLKKEICYVPEVLQRAV